jgi:hypothetical protein
VERESPPLRLDEDSRGDPQLPGRIFVEDFRRGTQAGRHPERRSQTNIGPSQVDLGCPRRGRGRYLAAAACRPAERSGASRLRRPAHRGRGPSPGRRGPGSPSPLPRASSSRRPPPSAAGASRQPLSLAVRPSCRRRTPGPPGALSPHAPGGAAVSAP